jgi:hypothetical protein
MVSELWTSIFYAGFRVAIFGYYTYSFWIGSKYIKDGRINPNNDEPYTTGSLLIVLMSIMIGVQQLLGITPNM